MTPRIACLDVGTSSVKGAVFDGEGAILSRTVVPLPPPSGEGTVREQPLLAIEEAVVHALSALLRDSVGSRWDALSLATQRGTLVVTDERGLPASELASWLDRRGDRWQWMKRERPAVAARTAGFRSLFSYLAEALTGVAAETAQTAAPETASLHRDGKRGPQLVSPGFVAAATGPLAARVGLSPALPVILAGGDKNVEMLGAGVLLPDIAVLSFGTAVSLGVLWKATASSPVPTERVYATPSVIDGTWHVEVGVPSGGALREWARRLLCLGPGVPLPLVPPEGLLFVPYLAGSLPFPGAAGSIAGMTLATTAGDVAAAAMAGLVLEIRRGRSNLRAAARFDRLAFCGGGAADARLAQWLCDALQVPVEVFPDGDRGLAGAAMVARRALEGGKPRTSDWLATTGVYRPRPAHRAQPNRDATVDWDHRASNFEAVLTRYYGAIAPSGGLP